MKLAKLLLDALPELFVPVYEPPKEPLGIIESPSWRPPVDIWAHTGVNADETKRLLLYLAPESLKPVARMSSTAD